MTHYSGEYRFIMAASTGLDKLTSVERIVTSSPADTMDFGSCASS